MKRVVFQDQDGIATVIEFDQYGGVTINGEISLPCDEVQIIAQIAITERANFFVEENEK